MAFLVVLKSFHESSEWFTGGKSWPGDLSSFFRFSHCGGMTIPSLKLPMLRAKLSVIEKLVTGFRTVRIVLLEAFMVRIPSNSVLRDLIVRLRISFSVIEIPVVMFAEVGDVGCIQE